MGTGLHPDEASSPAIDVQRANHEEGVGRGGGGRGRVRVPALAFAGVDHLRRMSHGIANEAQVPMGRWGAFSRNPGLGFKGHRSDVPDNRTRAEGAPRPRTEPIRWGPARGRRRGPPPGTRDEAAVPRPIWRRARGAPPSVAGRRAVERVSPAIVRAVAQLLGSVGGDEGYTHGPSEAGPTVSSGRCPTVRQPVEIEWTRVSRRRHRRSDDWPLSTGQACPTRRTRASPLCATGAKGRLQSAAASNISIGDASPEFDREIFIVRIVSDEEILED